MTAIPQCRRFGFTVIELVVALAVLIVLLAIGVPTFSELIASTKVTNATNSILGHLQYARGEAVKSGGRVAVGPYDTETTWKTDSSWQGGFMVAVVADADITIRKVLRRVDGAELKPLSVAKNGNSPRFYFHADGSAGGAGTLTISDPGNPDRWRNVVVDPVGRARVAAP